jgi:hypothetical protein
MLVCVRECSHGWTCLYCSKQNKKRGGGYVCLCQDHCRCCEIRLEVNKLKNKFLILMGVENLAMFGTFSSFEKVSLVIYICVL